MIKVYFESSTHADLVAVFADESLYKACLPVLEKQAEKDNLKLTETVTEEELGSTEKTVVESGRNYFEISGYWKDTKETFEGLIVTDYDDEPSESEPFSDAHIFFYGLSESEIKSAIELGEETGSDFVITSYNKIES